jgi:SnoaL-like polyketide cyclase
MSHAELVRRYTEEFKNHGNFDVVDEVCAENFVHHLLIPGLPEGRAGFKALGQFVTGAIGDITVTIELIVAGDGLVANRNRAHGTRKADVRS